MCGDICTEQQQLHLLGHAFLVLADLLLNITALLGLRVVVVAIAETHGDGWPRAGDSEGDEGVVAICGVSGMVFDQARLMRAGDAEAGRARRRRRLQWNNAGGRAFSGVESRSRRGLRDGCSVD